MYPPPSSIAHAFLWLLVIANAAEGPNHTENSDITSYLSQHSSRLSEAKSGFAAELLDSGKLSLANILLSVFAPVSNSTPQAQSSRRPFSVGENHFKLGNTGMNCSRAY